jgi:hypothetical protein
MAINFANVKTVKPAAKTKKSDKPRIEMEGMHEFAALAAVIKSLTSVYETMEADIKNQMAMEFVKAGCEKKARPENFKGYEGDNAEASCELRARSSASALSAAEQELFAEYNLPTKKVESIVDTFVINPEYAGNAELMNKIAKKLNTIKDIPEDLFMKQDGVSKTVVGEDALDAVFKLDAAAVTKLIRVVGTLAIKPRFSDMDVAMAAISHLVSNQD